MPAKSLTQPAPLKDRDNPDSRQLYEFSRQVFRDVSRNASYRSLTADYTAILSDRIFDCSGTFTLTVPSPPIPGLDYIVKNSGVGTITVVGADGETIDGAASLSVGSLYSRTLVSTVSLNWMIV